MDPVRQCIGFPDGGRQILRHRRRAQDPASAGQQFSVLFCRPGDVDALIRLCRRQSNGKTLVILLGNLLGDLRGFLGIESLEGIRILNRYDVEGIDPAVYEKAKHIVFSEPQVDVVCAGGSSWVRTRVSGFSMEASRLSTGLMR